MFTGICKNNQEIAGNSRNRLKRSEEETLEGPLTVLGSERELDSVLVQYLMLCTITIIIIIMII